MLPSLCLAVSATLHGQEAASVYKDPKAPVEKRVEDLLGQMTPEEKIDMIAGTGYMDLRAIPRLGIPSFKLTDGPMGTRCYGDSTGYANGIALAGTWDVDQAGRVGVAMGRDARARAVNIILGPAMNLYRAPMCGRNMEYLGEDPILAGNIASAFIKGVQSQGVGVTAKHFVANDQEFNRHGLTSDVEERTLRELQLKPFQICVKNGALGIMTSYNLLNGVHTSQNAWLNNTILKGEWGFKGLVMSDWDSCYDSAAMANGGLDLEMPSGKFFNRQKLLPLIADGTVKQAAIDDKVRRILRVGFELGWFDRPQLDSSIPKDDPSSDAVALQGARESVTLLKNTGNLLPLDQSKVSKVVVLGYNADPAMTGGGGSAYTKPFHSVSVLQGIKTLLGTNAEVTRVPVVPPPPEPPRDRARNAASATPTPSPATPTPTPEPAPEVPSEYADQVKAADVAVVCVGFNGQPHSYEGEGPDRSYALPVGQEDLIKAVVALNPKTIVILNAGGSVATVGWIDKIPVLIHAFYPGQDGGTAIAEILFGKTNPSGRLAFSWEKQWADCASYGNYPSRDNPKSNTYKEGVFLGYRWFDSKPDIAPLFPFGYGLSYTAFEFSGLKVSAPDAQGNITATATIKNTGKVAGAEVVQLYVQPPAVQPQAVVPPPQRTAGDGAPPADTTPVTVLRPVRELKGFTRVELAPGESKTATITFTRDDLAYWDPNSRQWTVTPGAYVVRLGGSSRDLPLKADMKL